MKIKLLKTTELAQILRTSPGYIRNQIHLGKEGKTIPPSIQLGRRRMWLESDLLIWLKSKNSNV
ncbi:MULTISPECIES: helix-turn-helix transcriptional regulator [unclassified Pseudoalteromonas]|uniref:helix-turn-helix transcriptional regulator n=1 Tax=unclassified Pseudoalteromonas TaxID=194690 RepID=UPI0034E04D67